MINTVPQSNSVIEPVYRNPTRNPVLTTKAPVICRANHLRSSAANRKLYNDSKALIGGASVIQGGH